MPERFEITRGPNQKEALAENVVLIEKDHARYRIVYGKHNLEQPSNAIGMPDGIILESGFCEYETQQQAVDSLSWLDKNLAQFHGIIKKAEKEEKPIFFVDIQKAALVGYLQLALPLLEVSVGYKMLRSLAEDIISDAPVTRRDFLKRSAQGVVGAYFLSHIPKMLSVFGGSPNEQSMKRAVDRFVTDLGEQMHPETWAVVLTLRNNMIAHKMETVAENFRNEKRIDPELALVCGSSHSGIDEVLAKTNTERIFVINRLLSVPGLDEAKRRVATIARLDFDNKEGHWTASIFKDPTLSSAQ